jgi:hypothetical protein
MAIARRDGEVTIVCIEAKVSESFGDTVASELQACRKRPRTDFPARLDCLTRSLFGFGAYEDDGKTVRAAVAGLRYQLLAAVAGTLIEARLHGASAAIFLVHQIGTEDAANKQALDEFLSLLYPLNGGPDEPVHLPAGELLGPISVANGDTLGQPTRSDNIPLFIGKFQTFPQKQVS